MPDRVHNVLFLCTHNSARSIMAEALLNHLSEGRFRAFSAGSEGGPGPKPMALKVLDAEGIPTEGLSSKTWDFFAKPGAPVMDLVITVCDQAAGEACPHWPGQPITAHWGIEDPSNVQGSEIERDASLTTTVLSSGVSIELIVDRLFLRELLESGPTTRSMLNFTSLAVNGSPEWKVTFGCRVKV